MSDLDRLSRSLTPDLNHAEPFTVEETVPKELNEGGKRKRNEDASTLARLEIGLNFSASVFLRVALHNERRNDCVFQSILMRPSLEAKASPVAGRRPLGLDSAAGQQRSLRVCGGSRTLLELPSADGFLLADRRWDERVGPGRAAQSPRANGSCEEGQVEQQHAEVGPRPDRGEIVVGLGPGRVARASGDGTAHPSSADSPEPESAATPDNKEREQARL